MPAIVRAESIMRVRVVPKLSTFDQVIREALRRLESDLQRHDDLLDAAIYQGVLYGNGILVSGPSPRVIPGGELERLVFRPPADPL